MNTMKRFIIMAAAILLIVSMPVFAAGGKEDSASASSASGMAEQKLTFALQNEPDGLDPGITNNSFASPVLLNVFEGLVVYDENNSIVGGSAESWDISADGLTYTFHLRKGLKWSDGSALTAGDFVYSYLRVLDPALGAQYTEMLTDYIVGAADYYAGTAGADIRWASRLSMMIPWFWNSSSRPPITSASWVCGSTVP